MFDERLEFLYGTESCQRVKESGRDRSGRQAGEREGRERETFRVRTSAREGKEKKETNRSRNGKKVRRGL